jgi:hypothetical protein
VAEVSTNEVGDLHFVVHKRMERKTDHGVVSQEDTQTTIVLVRLLVPADLAMRAWIEM